jgi:hypothetical protein
MLEALATLHDLNPPQRADWCRDLLHEAAEAVLRGAEAAEG